jgi:formamidopyrimidine-DNA glycosylase
MIELPEAAVIAGQIDETLPGKRIVHAVAGASPHKFAWYSGDPSNYQQLLAGKTIQEACAFGNHVEIHADDRILVISTPILYHREGEKPPKKHQLYLEFKDCSAISCTVQMWGALMCYPQGEVSGLPDYEIARHKPSPLCRAFDQAYFDSLFDAYSGSLSVKEFLATKQRIPGLGNGVLQDILWSARIHPKRKLGDLSGEDLEAMYTAVKNVLTAMADQGGRDTERDLFGRPGGYRTILSKNTLHRPCPVCGSAIRKEAYLGGAIYYCEGCQRL